MEWSNSLKNNVFKLMRTYTTTDIGGLPSMNFNRFSIIAYEGQSNIFGEFIPDEINYKYELEQPIMIPIPAGTAVNSLKLKYGNNLFYEIILEGDEIKEFPNGGALVIENLEINLIFE